MYVVYWRCVIYYTDLVIHNGMASLKKNWLKIYSNALTVHVARCSYPYISRAFGTDRLNRHLTLHFNRSFYCPPVLVMGHSCQLCLCCVLNVRLILVCAEFPPPLPPRVKNMCFLGVDICLFCADVLWSAADILVWITWYSCWVPCHVARVFWVIML